MDTNGKEIVKGKGRGGEKGGRKRKEKGGGGERVFVTWGGGSWRQGQRVRQGHNAQREEKVGLLEGRVGVPDTHKGDAVGILGSKVG